MSNSKNKKFKIMSTKLADFRQGIEEMLLILAIAGMILFTKSILQSREAVIMLENQHSATIENSLLFVQENAVLGTSGPSLPEPDRPRTMNVIITGYSSTSLETDETPFLTASGSLVRDGIVANNSLPIGTKIKIPVLYGDKIFVVEDRMHWKKSPYHIDIWFPSYSEARNFGVKKTKIEVLES